MKKALSLLFIASAMSIVACGPSAEEKAKQEETESAMRDSLMDVAGASMEAALEAEAIDSAATIEAEAPEKEAEKVEQ